MSAFLSAYLIAVERALKLAPDAGGAHRHAGHRVQDDRQRPGVPHRAHAATQAPLLTLAAGGGIKHETQHLNNCQTVRWTDVCIMTDVMTHLAHLDDAPGSTVRAGHHLHSGVSPALIQLLHHTFYQ